MKNTEKIKTEVINLSNDLGLSDGQLLDLFLDYAGLVAFVKVRKKLKEFKEEEKCQ